MKSYLSLKSSLVSCIILFSNQPSEAFPVSIDIGTFAIDDYSSNGGGAGNLNYMIASGQNFFWAANAQCSRILGRRREQPGVRLGCPEYTSVPKPR